MNLKSIRECERKKLHKWSEFQLANKWKKIGVILSLVIFLTLILTRATDSGPIWLSDILRRGLIVSLMIIALSKEKVEDEMITSIRAKSFILAFMIGVLYVVLQPIIELILHNFIFESKQNNSLGYFELLFYMIWMQIIFFHTLYWNR